MIGAYFAATLISVSAQQGYAQSADGYRGDGGFGLQYAPTTTQAPSANWDQYVWKITDSWEETDADSGQVTTGFKSIVTVPVLEDTEGQWSITLLFSKPVANLVAWNVIIADWSFNLTDYMIVNKEHNGFLQQGQLLEFDMMGHTIGEPPQAVVDWPAMSMSFANPDDSQGFGGGGQESHDFRDILSRSINFFVAQRSGKLPNDQNSIDWRGNSALGDGGDVQLDLVGGYFVGGDHVKWGFPMAFATTMIAWSGINYGDAYAEMGYKGELYKQVKWATDYFVKCHPEEYVFYAQVGVPEVDHKEWIRPEYMEMERPSIKLDANNPGSDVAAETAAALAAAAILFSDEDSDYAEELLTHAIVLLEFAQTYRGEYDESIPSAKSFYRSLSYGDELAWAALWLYYATDDQQYLTFADDIIAEFNLDDTSVTPSEFSYDDKTVAVNFLHALLTENQNDPGVEIVTNFCDSMVDRYNQDGHLYLTDWHNFGSTSGIAWICLFAADKIVTGATEVSYLQFAVDNVNDVLGKGERSYMVGYGFNPPKRPHHRASSCPIEGNCGWGVFGDKYTANEFVLEGAIVGGPGTDGFYEDNRADYTRNEPSLVGNALFQATVSGIRQRELYDEYPGGYSLPNEDYSYIFEEWPFPEGTNVVDYCNLKTCKNDGSCYNDYTNFTYVCECEDGYYGSTCDTIIEPVVQFVRKWGHGGEFRVKLPSERPIGAWQVLLEFPSGCEIETMDIWHACFDPYASSRANGTFYIYQVGWHQGHEEIGVVFQSPQAYNQYNYWDSSASCFAESEYSLTLVARGSHQGDNVQGMTLLWSTDPDRCPGELPWVPPEVDPDFPDTLILGGEEAIDQAFLDLMVNNYEGTGRTTDGLEVEWVAPGETAAWMRIWLPVETPQDELWQLRMRFPEQCEPLTIIGYQTCINTAYSSLSTSGNARYGYGVEDTGAGGGEVYAEATYATLFLYQNGTDLQMDFIGLRIKFADPDNAEPCLDANAYVFEMLVWDDPQLAENLTAICETMFPDQETQLEMLGETAGIVVPQSPTPSMEFVPGPLSWTQGANGHFFLPSPKPFTPFGLRVQVPAGCNIQRINFWHACVVMQNSDINSGMFELEQIGWQQEHGYIGFSVDFQPAQYQQSGVPDACKDATEYMLQIDDRTLDPNLGITFNGYYNSYPDSCRQSLGEALEYSPYEVQLQDGMTNEDQYAPGAYGRNIGLQRTDFGDNQFEKANDVGRPMYHASESITDRVLSSTDRVQMAGWARKFDTVKKEERFHQEQIQAAKQQQNQNNQQNNVDQGFQPQTNFNPAGGSLQSAGSFTRQSSGDPNVLPSSSIPVNFEQTVMDSSSAELYWRHPAGQHDKYKISYVQVPDPNNPIQLKMDMSATIEYVSGSMTKFDMKDLIPGARYEAEIFSVVGKKESHPQRLLFATIPEDPLDVAADADSANKVKVTWRHNIGNRENYRVSYFPGAPNGSPQSPATVNGMDEELTITGLDGNTDYIFVVSAESYNIHSDGTYAQASTGTDWCQLKGTVCGTNGECVNYASFGRCECAAGYTGDGFTCSDVNECLSGKAKCDPNAICQNTIGSHTCTCPAGFLDHTGEGTDCRDVNECESLRPRCHHEGHCVNYPGSYACECKPGYFGDGQTYCNDIDECESEDNPCSAHAECTNTVGSVTCVCKQGFEGDGFECIDNNECELGTHNCAPLGGKCWNKPGGHGCKCQEGFSGSGWKCSDINECDKPVSPCHERAECHNEPGTFRCKCKEGYRGDGIKLCVDLDECASGMHKCDPYAMCKNYVGTHRCKCRRGFEDTGMAYRDECKDIDECVDGSHKCVGANIRCLNVPGGYNCKCKEGYMGDMRRGCKDQDECVAGTHKCSANAKCLNTQGSHKCTCKGGFKGDGMACDDVNECQLGQHSCNQPGTRCVNTPGSFECQCKPGYAGTPRTGCFDVNECNTGGSNCAADAVCVNTVGSFDCECSSGLGGNGKYCNDIDECSTDSHNCHESAECTNTFGSFTCNCKSGFNGDGYSCSDVNECESGTANCGDDAICINYPGGFDCSCPAGHNRIGGNQCESKDLCSNNPCPAGSQCSNSFGIFVCSCPVGKYGTPATGCYNIDECMDGSAGCHKFATCTDSDEGYECNCNTGYQGDGHTCTDVDECLARSNKCDRNSKCENSDGGYDCTCKPGYIGDGMTCQLSDPCLGGEHNCRAPQACVATGGSNFKCICMGGYFPPADAPETCIDLDECTMGMHKCAENEDCVNNIGGYDCNCKEGAFKQSGVCRERDECSLGLHNCDENASCLNTAKGFKCTCKDGYSGDGMACIDVDECIVGVERFIPTKAGGKAAKNTPACPGADCVNVIGSFRCKCKEGFKIASGKCVDINECETGAHDCPAIGSRCMNKQGTYRCSCSPGYLGNGIDCIKSKCPALREVPNMETDFCTINSCTMKCAEGFKYSGGERNRACDWRGKWEPQGQNFIECEDVDECAEGIDDCDREYGICRNTRGSFVCSCPPGFKGDGLKCFEVDECAMKTHNCHEEATCENSIGAHICTCNAGFFGSGVTCSDDNECRDPNICSGENMRCVNTFGSYKCQCEVGFQQNGDQCLPAPAAGSCAKKKCHLQASCVAFGKNAQCICNKGFKGSGMHCEDENECLLETFECHGNATCTNTPGGYNCNCPSTMIGDGKDCQESTACDASDCAQNADCIAKSASLFECKCKEGFWGNGYQCTDKNECLKRDVHGCSTLATCINSLGSYECNCDQGYEGDGKLCTDTDECAAGTHNCHSGGFCINTPGSYKCKCRAGFKGDGEVCVDINECYNLQHNCHHTATCKNFGGGYSCRCPDGYFGNGLECVDINECATRKHNCGTDSKCINKDGGFHCECEEGYFGDGITCIKDRCDELRNSTCAENTDCIPKDNESIQCFCKDGYKGDGYTKCDDINECFRDSTLCADPKNKCQNTDGSYECVCADGFAKNQLDVCVNDVCRYEKCHKNAKCSITTKYGQGHSGKCECLDGYSGDGVHYCSDINECVFNIHDCSPRAKCANDKGTFTCTCMEGYEGDGKECLAPAQVEQKQIIAQREAALFAATALAEEEGEEEVVEEIDPCTADSSSPCFGDQECSRLSNTEYDCTCPRGKSITKEGYCINAPAGLSSITSKPAAGAAAPSRFGPAAGGRQMFGKPSPAGYQSHLTGPASAVGGKKPSNFWQSRSKPAAKPAWKPPAAKPIAAKPAWKRPVPTPMKKPVTTLRPITTRKVMSTRPPWQQTTRKPAWTQPFRTTPRTYTTRPTSTTWRSTTTPFSFVEQRVETTEPFIQTTRNQAEVNFNNNLWNQQRTTTEGYERTTTHPRTTPSPNECTNGMHKCDVKAMCVDKTPGYTCTCPPGFAGDGFVCNDIDECAQPGKCAYDSVCTNAPGSYVCTCKPGFTGTSGSCNDENECLTGRHTCGDATCINTAGSFECECMEGYEMDDASGACVDVNECLDNACHPDADCTNTPGTYACACSSGYKGNGLLCMNIDECSTGTHNCAPSDQCQDTKGSFECVGVQCPPVGTFDLALLLDTHTDMGTPNLEATRAFAKSIVEKFDIGSDTTKVTVAGYSGEKVTPSTFLLDSNTNTKEQMLSTMSNINFSGRDLRIERALAFLINFSFLEAMGRRKDKPGIAILTAGQKTLSTTALDAVVRRLRADKTTRYITIGIGEASKSELAGISGNPQYVFMIDDYSGLNAIVPDILKLICEIDAEFKENL